jgi:LysR family transcriptional regulator (chromosome initiation inhibitor)
LLNAIRSGNGYGLVPAHQADELLASGQLVNLAPRNGLCIPLFWHHWQQEPPLARQVTGFVVEFARAALGLQCAASGEIEEAGAAPV